MASIEGKLKSYSIGRDNWFMVDKETWKKLVKIYQRKVNKSRV